jgi:hypothetical protein
MPTHLGDGPQRVVLFENTSSQRRTLIRKTSLLHKIEPTARRSSFADIPGISHRISGIRIAPDSRSPIVEFPNGDSAPSVTFDGQRRSDRSPLHDVRYHGRRRRCRRCPNSVSHERVLPIAQSIARPSGGARRDRTDDLLLAKQALSQLSYGPAPVSTDWHASRSSRQPARPAFAKASAGSLRYATRA